MRIPILLVAFVASNVSAAVIPRQLLAMMTYDPEYTESKTIVQVPASTGQLKPPRALSSHSTLSSSHKTASTKPPKTTVNIGPTAMTKYEDREPTPTSRFYYHDKPVDIDDWERRYGSFYREHINDDPDYLADDWREHTRHYNELIDDEEKEDTLPDTLHPDHHTHDDLPAYYEELLESLTSSDRPAHHRPLYDEDEYGNMDTYQHRHHGFPDDGGKFDRFIDATYGPLDHELDLNGDEDEPYTSIVKISNDGDVDASHFSRVHNQAYEEYLDSWKEAEQAEESDSTRAHNEAKLDELREEYEDRKADRAKDEAEKDEKRQDQS